MFVELDEETPRLTDCPYCGGGTIVPIMFGFPSQEILEAAERGEVIVGGCHLEPGFPNETCNSCGRAPSDCRVCGEAIMTVEDFDHDPWLGQPVHARCEPLSARGA